MQYSRPARTLVFDTPPRHPEPSYSDDGPTLRMERARSLAPFEVAPPPPLPARPLDLPAVMRSQLPTPVPWMTPPPAKRGLPLWPLFIVLAACGLALLSPELQSTLASAVDAFAR